MTVKRKNLTFQSCRYCNVGGALFRVDSEEGTFYVCEEHRKKDFIKDVPVEGVEEEFGAKAGLLAKAVRYIKGG